MRRYVKLEELIGKTMSSVTNQNNEEIVFVTTDGQTYKLYHEDDCYESVTVEDVIGDLSDLIGEPIRMAEEVIHDDETPEGTRVPEYEESYTWTFYKFATIKGYVTIRWFGSSNGYYSETVDFAEVTP